MDRDQLRRIAGREKVPLGTVEKDYITSAVLAALSDYPESDKMAFKGGTCIKKVYFPLARFSVDLDFSCPERVSRPLFEYLQLGLASKQVHGVQFMDVVEEERNDSGARFSLKHKETSGHASSVKLDLSFREKPSAQPQLKEVLNPFGYALPSCRVMALTLEEILSEKIRAVIARNAPRDVYDVWFLLTNKVHLRLDFVAEKLKVLKRDRSFDPGLFASRIEEQREAWQRDLGPLMGAVPDFDRVKREIEALIEKL